MNSIKFSEAAIRLDERDSVAIAKVNLPAGIILEGDSTYFPPSTLEIHQAIGAGHKIATREIAPGEEIIRYGCRIGAATRAIKPGEWIHTHNMSVGDMRRNFTGVKVVKGYPNKQGERFFMGYQRSNGCCGTRNYILVVCTVNCAAQTTQAIAADFPPEVLSNYPNVDGVIAITHTSGCSFPEGSLAHQYLQRSLINLIDHPNVGGILFVGLGCEVNQLGEMVTPRISGENNELSPGTVIGPYLEVQKVGGMSKTLEAGKKAVLDMLPQVNRISRSLVPISKLKIALQCGGSDSWSGITANPLMGKVSDQVVNSGGTVVLSETPEIFGAEYLLTSRVNSKKVAQKLIARIKWWQNQAKLLGFSLDNNPSPGNKAGGLTTIFEKSLGAVSKGGSTPLMDVVEYAETITSTGLVFMDTPGNDPISITGQVSGGCNLVLFSTGRGSVFGGRIAPCIKVASNSVIFHQMEDDMDYDAGPILENKTMQSASNELLDLVIQVASGAPTQAQRNLFRESEFVPWQPGIIL